MAVASGQFGTLKYGASEVVETQGWTLTKRVAAHTYASNSTAGYKKAVAGVKSGVLTVEGQYDFADPIDSHLDVGTLYTLNGYISASKFYAIPALIESIELMVDFDEGKIVSWKISGPTNGAWTNPV